MAYERRLVDANRAAQLSCSALRQDKAGGRTAIEGKLQIPNVTPKPSLSPSQWEWEVGEPGRTRPLPDRPPPGTGPWGLTRSRARTAPTGGTRIRCRRWMPTARPCSPTRGSLQNSGPRPTVVQPDSRLKTANSHWPLSDSLSLKMRLPTSGLYFGT